MDVVFTFCKKFFCHAFGDSDSFSTVLFTIVKDNNFQEKPKCNLKAFIFLRIYKVRGTIPYVPNLFS